MDRPRYLNGEPQNLEAAALDALEWLLFAQQYLKYNHLGQSWNTTRRRLTRCIGALEPYVLIEPIFEETPRPPAYGAVAILDPVHHELLEEEE